MGEIDARTASLLTTRLADATVATTPPGPVVADLGEVEFIGSAGMSMLITAHRDCLARALSLRIVAGRAVTHRLTMLGLGEHLTIMPTLTEALHDQQPPAGHDHDIANPPPAASNEAATATGV